MVAVRLSPFGGMVPAVDDRLLPNINGALSQDTWLYSGTVVGLPVPKNVHTLTNVNAGKVYRIPNNFTDSVHFSDSVWMEFASIDTDVIRSSVLSDTFQRYYWVSPLDVPRYFPLASIRASVPAVAGAYILGVPAPTGTLVAVPSGGASTTLKSIAYVQTFVSAYGEEGPPSAAVNLTGVKIDATVTLTLRPADPNDLGTNRNLTRTRIYRTVTAANGVATLFFVAEQAIGLTSYVDNAATATDALIALNTILPSTTWTGPPSDLQGMVSLANGMVAGFRQNELWFCEPYRMHAWPSAYTLVTEYPIVGLGVSSQTLVVATQGFAYTANGINPVSISLNKLPGLLPCTSRGSIVSTAEGVYFSTPAGLILVSVSGLHIATKELIRKDKWNSLVPTSTLRAAKLGPAYYAFGRAITGVFEPTAFEPTAFAQQDFAGSIRGNLIDTTSKEVAFNILTSALPVVNVQTDAWSSEVFIIRNGQVQWMDIGDATQPKNPYLWRSKKFYLHYADNFQILELGFMIPAGTPAQSPTANLAQVQTLAANQYGLVRVYADDRLVMTREVRAVNDEMRLPSGFKADTWQFEFEGRVELTSMYVASSARELREL